MRERDGGKLVKRWLMATICPLAIASAAAPAPAQVYLHNEGDAKAVSNAKAGIQSSKAAFFAMFDANLETLAKLTEAERTAAFNASLARRDQQLASVLDKRRDPKQAADQLEKFIKRRQADIAGPQWEPAGAPIGSIDAWRRKLEENRDALAEHVHDRDGQMALYRENGGKQGVACNDEGKEGKAPPADTPLAARQYLAAAQASCAAIANVAADIQRDLDRLPAPLAVGFGDSKRVSELGPGQLQAAARQQKQLRELVKAQKALSSTAGTHLKQLEKYLKCEQRRAGSPGADERIREATKEFQDFVEWVGKLDENSGANLAGPDTSAAAPEAEPVPRVCTIEAGSGTGSASETVQKPKAIKSPEDLADRAKKEQNATLPGWDDIKKLVADAASFHPTRSLAASLQEETQRFREGLLGEVLAGLASDVNDPQRWEATVASNLVKAVGHFHDIQPDRLPRTSAVLIDVAAARLKAATARVEADRLDQLAALADLKVKALGRELLQLQQARQSLKKADQGGLDRATRIYATSWTQSRAAQPVIEVDMMNLDYFAWARRERATVEATYAMLEPALGELEEYGAGGLRPADFARILNTAGLGALAVEGD